ncbi:MAG TPA: helix-turn-helix domain-containing protein [Thermoleophilia bacterium]|nr:helix-turn-helix domain-containing protein [Thermoleophilia bacterium]
MSQRGYHERDYEFGRRVRALRTGCHLTQSDLAEHLGVSRQTVVAWEGGASYPAPVHLRRLVDLCLDRQAFDPGHEAEEIRGLWLDARLQVPLDEVWLAHLLGASPESPSTPAAASMGPGDPGPVEVVRRLDWGQAPEASEFFGRSGELTLLTRWLFDERCRVVSVLGMGGIGKTALAARLAQQAAPHYERLYWRSLRDAPPAGDWLAGCIDTLSDHRVVPPLGDSERLATLLHLLRERSCLLVLDNYETLFEPGGEQGRYRTGMDGYGRLLEAVAGAGHDSCLLLTSREAPPELALLGATLGSLTLGGLGVDEAERMLASKGLSGRPEQWAELVSRYGGNGLALKLVAERIRELFGGHIELYLRETSASVFGGIRELLSEQAERSSAAERDVLRMLAVAREPVPLAGLLAARRPRLGREAVLEAVEALQRRSLLERVQTTGPAAFTLQSVVLEYVTGQLVDDVVEEIEDGRSALLLEQALIQAQAREYVRESQTRLIGLPILKRLEARLGHEQTEKVLQRLLEGWRSRPSDEQGYGPGNVINLLRLVRGDLRAVDMSRLVIRQGCLSGVDAQDSSLVGAHLAETVLAEAFDPPGSVGLSGDGALLAAGTSTGEVWVWRVADRTPLWKAEGHPGGAWSLAVSADCNVVASGGFDGTVKLWEAGSGESLATMDGHVGAVWGVALSADGGMVASAGADGTVQLWEAGGGRPLRTLEGHAGVVWGVALSADGRLAASAGADGTMRLWEAGSGRALAAVDAHDGGVRSVALSADGRLAATGGYDGTVKLWQTDETRLLATLQGHTEGVSAVALSADGRSVASGSFDGTVRLWDAETGLPQATFVGHTQGAWAVALSADGRLAASGSFDGTLRLWEADGKRPLATFQGDRAACWAVTLSADGSLVASGGAAGRVRLWEADSGRLLAAVEAHSGGVSRLAFSIEAGILASGGYDGTVKLWEAGSWRALATLEGHSGGVSGVALSADGRLLVSGSFDGTVRSWEVPRGHPLATMEGHLGVVWGVALSRDGGLAASAGADGTVRLWETPRGRLLRTLEGHDGVVWDVALSADGRLVASSGADGTVRLWETDSGRLLATMEAHPGAGVSGVALSADGRLVASCGADAAVRLWETDSARLVATFRGHVGAVWKVALSADGELTASAGGDGTARLWRTGRETCLRVLRPERPYESMDITGLTGVTEAQRDALLALGAIEQGG